MKKRKNKKSAINPQPLELVLDPMDTLMVMEAGTKVSCKLTEVLTSSGSGIIGMSAAVFGLAKVTVLLRHLIVVHVRRGGGRRRGRGGGGRRRRGRRDRGGRRRRIR